MPGVTVRGLEEAKSNLKAFAAGLSKDCLRKALAAAARVFEAAIRERIPYAPNAESAKEYGLLRDDLETIITIDESGAGGVAQLCFPRKDMVVRWVEYGHRLVRGGRFGKGGRKIGNVEPEPFLRRAFDAAAEAATEAFVREVQAYTNSGTVRAN